MASATLRIEPRYYHQDPIYRLARYEDLGGGVALRFDTVAATCHVLANGKAIKLRQRQAAFLLAYFATELHA